MACSSSPDRSLQCDLGSKGNGDVHGDRRWAYRRSQKERHARRFRHLVDEITHPTAPIQEGGDVKPAQNSQIQVPSSEVRLFFHFDQSLVCGHGE